MIDLSRHWHLQLTGRLVFGDSNSRSIGTRLFLQPGVFSISPEGLGITHQRSIPLPLDILSCHDWLLDGYQFWDAPEGGTMHLELKLHQLMHLRTCLDALPPFLIRLDRRQQPSFYVGFHERNPCPGWIERVHVYQKPESPFEATAVAYIDGRGDIASAELFNVGVRLPSQGGATAYKRRLWVGYSNAASA